jgi:DNA segregation ATPase FtsK/SpoIIIE, S-DNA-T family
VVGAIMAVAGLIILLILFSAQRSALTGNMIRVLRQIIGWGVYILPIALILMGLWLILRRIEKLPPLSLERATGIILFFLWLLAAMHSIIAAPDMAGQAAIDGAGGGYVGSLFERAMFNSFGTGGAIVALIAWLLITLTMIFDISVQDLFQWVRPLAVKIRAILDTPIAKSGPAIPPKNEGTSSNGFTPLDGPEPLVATPAPGMPVTTVRPAEAIIHWQLPDVKDILDSGTAPILNDEFIEQRARLIEETLASFGAPVRVVEKNRGPTITQFGAEPLFVETRSGSTKVRVSKIASLADDLALALAAPRIRIQAPVPGHSYVGIEVPNDETSLVALRDLLESEVFQRNQNPLRFALGKDVTGHPINTTLETMPHLLIAGTIASSCTTRRMTCV